MKKQTIIPDNPEADYDTNNELLNSLDVIVENIQENHSQKP